MSGNVVICHSPLLDRRFEGLVPWPLHQWRNRIPSTSIKVRRSDMALMRTHGTLAKWNDDRGFGFIAPANGTADLFVHISAFPRDGVRPRLNELISFEIESGPDGKRRAVRVMRPGRRTTASPGAARERHGPENRGLAGVFTLLAVAGLGAYGYSQYTKRVAAMESPVADVSPSPVSAPSPYSCDGRTMCSQMTSCAEATYFIRSCPDTEMDGDNDGVPCESQWCGH
jgi:cold shock CspA family protein